MDDRDLYSGLIRLHILHHSVEGPIFGLEMAEELARHGYRIRWNAVSAAAWPGKKRLPAFHGGASRQIVSQNLSSHAARSQGAQGSEVQGSGVVWRTHRGRVICGIERDNFRESLCNAVPPPHIRRVNTVGAGASVSNRRSSSGRPASLRVLYLRQRRGHAGGNRPDWAGFRVQLGRPSQSATARHSSNRRYLPVEQSHLPAWRNGTERLRYHRHGIGRQDRLHQRIEVHSPDRHLYYV